MESKTQGKFVLSALEDTIKVWALANAFTHSQVLSECKVQGYILGGGDIGISDDRKKVGVSSESYDFGSLPNIVLTYYFQHFGYEVHADMNEKRIKDEKMKWFREHGIEI